jgi:phytoene desaturase
MRAIVIGTGAGSLASALRLRALGFEVDVLEACPDPGGRARTFSIRGHRFDAGPTVITAPWLFDELFALFGEKREDYVTFLPCDPWYRLSFADGSSLDLVSTIEEQERQIANLSPDDATQYRAYLAHTEELYKVGYEELGAADFTNISSMFGVVPELFRLGAFRSLWSHTARYFKDKRIRQAFSLQTLLVGGNPITTTAIYALIHAMERRGGIWFTKGGTGALINELVSLASRHGVRFHYNCEVTGFSYSTSGAITTVQSKADGIVQEQSCDLCVWGGDPLMAYSLLGSQNLSVTERLRAKTAELSMGLYVLYFKTSRTYDDCAHHTIVLSERWEELLKDIFNGSELPPDPSLYLHRPASTDRSYALHDGDLFYVLAPVPHLGKFANWEAEEPTFKRTVLSILEERILPGLTASLEFAEAVDPRYFKATLHSSYGAGFSLAPTLQQSAWFRFHNRADKIPNLYLCGAGVHPGGGLPGVVTSAKVVERLIASDFQGRVNRYTPSSNHVQGRRLEACA